MNVKQFRRRWLNHYVEPELFYVPVGKKEKESEEFIFTYYIGKKLSDYSYNETTEKTRFTFAINPLYSIGTSFSVSFSDGNFNMDYEFPNRYLNAFKQSNNTYAICPPVSSSGKIITKKEYPEVFTDFPIHDIEKGKISESLIYDDFYLQVDWGDGTINTYRQDETKKYSIGTISVYINNVLEEIPIYRRMNLYCKDAYHANVQFPYRIEHLYEKDDVEYTIKIKGNIPSFSVNTNQLFGVVTELIKYTDLDFRCVPSLTVISESGLNNIKYYEPNITVDELNKYKCRHDSLVNYNLYKSIKLDKINTLRTIINRGADWDITFVDDLSFLDNVENIISVSYNILGQNIFPKIISDKFLKKSKYLTQIIQAFTDNNNATNMNLSSYKDYLTVYNNHTTIEDNVLSGMENLLNVTYLIVSPAAVDKVGNNFLSNCPNLATANYLFQNMYGLTEIGDNLLRNSYGLVSISNLFSGCYNLSKIGSGLLRDSPNIRRASYMFSNCWSLKKIPEYLFYDLNIVNPIYSPNTLFLNNLFENINETLFLKEQIINNETLFIGEHLLPQDLFFEKGGKILLSTDSGISSWLYTWSTKTGSNIEISDNTQESKCYPGISTMYYYNKFSGYAPDLWNHMDSIGGCIYSSSGQVYENEKLRWTTFKYSVQDVISFNVTEEDKNNVWLPKAMYGHQQGFYDQWFGAVSYQYFLNYNDIPKPIGVQDNIQRYSSYIDGYADKKFIADDIWLEPVYYTYFSQIRAHSPVINHYGDNIPTSFEGSKYTLETSANLLFYNNISRGPFIDFTLYGENNDKPQYDSKVRVHINEIIKNTKYFRLKFINNIIYSLTSDNVIQLCCSGAFVPQDYVSLSPYYYIKIHGYQELSDGNKRIDSQDIYMYMDWCEGDMPTLKQIVTSPYWNLNGTYAHMYECIIPPYIVQPLNWYTKEEKNKIELINSGYYSDIWDIPFGGISLHSNTPEISDDGTVIGYEYQTAYEWGKDNRTRSASELFLSSNGHKKGYLTLDELQSVISGSELPDPSEWT